MKKLKNLIWSIPAIALYFYTATVLTEYGYISYFNIPSNFVSASLSDNIIYFFQLFVVGKYEFGLMRWWAWLILFLVIAFVMLLYHLHDFWRMFISIVGTVAFFLILGGFYNFGRVIATNTATFWVPAADCPPIGSDTRYVIPASYGIDAILVPIDQNNKMTGGIIVKNTADLNCKLDYKYIGTVVR